MSSLTSIALAIGTLALAWPTAARAQHCHIDTAPRPTTTATQPPPVAISVGTRVTAGVARVPELTTPMMIDRAYQGADLVVDVAWRRLSAEARLGAFRVDGHGVGLDDLGVAAAVALTPAHAPVAVSALGGATLPTGDADAGRGMGHVMVAGGATARVRGARLGADATVTYARALGDGAEHAAHAHGADLWPLIDPMSAEEITVELGGAAAIGPRGLAVRASGLFGQPISHGTQRLIATGGVSYGRGRYQVGATLSAPAVSEAFITRGQLTLAYHY